MKKAVISTKKINWKEKQKRNFCRNRQCPFWDGWNLNGCKQNSDASKCAARDVNGI